MTMAFLDKLESNGNKDEDDSPEDEKLMMSRQNNDSVSAEEKEIMDRMYNNLCKALMLGIAYCSSIGGVGMLTGTGPNLISVNFAMDNYDYSINFVNWAAFATPLSILMTMVAWGFLTFFFLMDKGTASDFENNANFV